MNLSLKIIGIAAMAFTMGGCTVYQKAPAVHKPYKKTVKVAAPLPVAEHNSPNIIVVKTKPAKKTCTKHKDYWHCKR